MKLSLAVVGVAALFLAACKDEQSAVAPQPARPVVVIDVTEQIYPSRRLIGGIVRASERADLAFRAAGRVSDLNVDIGDSVRRGSILARLDPTIPLLRERQAQASVSRVAASLDERRRRLDVQQRLYTSGYTTLQALRAAKLEVTTGEAELRDAQAALALAARDVSDTTLLAPYDGIVAAREVERNSEVSAGQIVFRLDGAGQLEVASNLPSSLIDSAKVDAPVEVSITAINTPLTGVISRVGGRGESGLTFPIVVRLPANARASGVRPGMVADVLFSGEKASRLILPLTAVVPSSRADHGYVFVLRPDGTAVSRRTVTVGGVGDEGVRILDGLNAGERVVAVGAAFLSDGASVRPLAGR